MSDMYLTKVERKTIFTRALVYIILMFVVSDLTMTGPYFFNFIPWMFLLGIFSKSKYIKPIQTIFISSFTVFISAIIVEGKFDLSVVIFTATTVVLVLLGSIVGNGIMYLTKEKKLEQFLPKNKKIFMVIIIIITTIVAIVTSEYIYSGAYKYVKSYISLKNDLKKEYQIEEFSIEKVSLSNKFNGKYVFKIKTNKYEGFEFKFIQNEKGIYFDTMYDTRVIKLKENVNKVFNNKVTEKKYILNENEKINFAYNNDENSIMPTKLVMAVNITKYDVEKNVNELLEKMLFYAEFIEKYKKENFTSDMEIEIELAIDNKVFTIKEESFNDIDKMFVINGLLTYEIDAI